MKKIDRKASSTKPTVKASSALQKKTKGKPSPQAAIGNVKTKTALLIDQLCKPGGRTIAELQATVGWQAHSVHGFMAGTLKKKGLSVGSEGRGSERRYRLLGSRAQP